MRIGFFELEGWENRHIVHELQNHEVYLSKAKLTKDNLPPALDLDVVSISVESRIDEHVLGKMPNLKLIATRSRGIDHIDASACVKRGIVISYVPGYGDNTVAEFAMGLLLTLTRKIYEAVDRIKEASSFSLDGLRGIDLFGKTMGIIGTGRIGKEMVRIANGLGMRVVAYDPEPDNDFARATGFEYKTLEELLKTSDVISLHCPHSEKTKHIINKANIGYIKKGAYLVNTSRGSVLSTEALVIALQEGILAGAALDVLEEEGETKDEVQFISSGHPNKEAVEIVLRNHLLMKMPNVIITPHMAFNTAEALQRILNTTIMSVKSFLSGRPINTLNPKELEKSAA